MKDFFISYASADVAWASWIAAELEDAGYTTVYQKRDFGAGASFFSHINEAMEGCRRTIAVYSPGYFTSEYCALEWHSALDKKTLLPVNAEPCEVPDLLRTIVYIDLLKLDERGARAKLLEEVAARGGAVSGRAPFPREGAKPRRFPRSLPAVWQVPLSRNVNFTGRDAMLDELHSKLHGSGAAALTAIAGLGGVGKTQLALEYCYRFASEYEMVWWMRSEEPATLVAEYARLAIPLNLPEKDLADQQQIISAVRDRLAHDSGWLLVFDNAEGPEHCHDYLPHSNAGQVIFTSRNPAWRGHAQLMEVRQLSREESVAFLKKRTGRDESGDADSLSAEVGDLPLALEHAAAYVDAKGISVGEYLDLYRKYSKKLMAPVQRTWQISFDRLQQENTAAVDLLRLIAFLAPDDIPRDLLQSTAADELEFNESVEALRRFSLIETGAGTVSVHRLVQEATRHGLEEADRGRWAEAALTLVNDAFPSDAMDYRNWPLCWKLLTHALEVSRYAEELGVGLAKVSRLLNQAGLYERARAQLASAERWMRRALAIDEKVHGTEHPEVAIRASNLGTILQDQGDLEGALKYEQRALKIHEQVYGPVHPFVAKDANNLGAVLKAQGDLDGALQYTHRALEIHEKALGPDHPEVATCAGNLGQILQAQGDLEEALTYTRRALEIHEKALGLDDPSVAIDANNLGQILQAQGDLEEALTYTRRALEIHEKALGPDHPNVAIGANNMGTILRAQGDFDGALKYVRRALRIFKQTYGPEHPSTRIAAENLQLLEEAIARNAQS